MAWGGKPQHILDMIVASEQPAAQDYLNRPDLPEHLLFVFNAFWDLAHPDGIPFGDLDRYASRYGITGVDDFTFFAELIRRMFAKWVELRAKKDVEVVDEDGERPRPKPVPKIL